MKIGTEVLNQFKGVMDLRVVEKTLNKAIIIIDLNTHFIW